MDITLKRAYEAYASTDGYRILVDRLWPRGVSKQKAAIDYWAKEVAPSTKLRSWFGHSPEKFEEFTRRYEQELAENSEAVDELLEQISGLNIVTFVYGAKDEIHNQAQVLKTYIEQKLENS